MEIHQSGKLDLNDVLLKYGIGRFQNDKQLPERLELNIDKKSLNENISKAAESAFRGYLQKKDREGVLAEDTAYGTTHNIMLHSEIVEPNVPLTLVTMLSKGFLRRNGAKFETLDFKLLKGEIRKEELDKLEAGHREEHTAHFFYEKNGKIWDLRHREVNTVFRRQGLGEAMLKAGERFLQTKANEDQEEQIIEVTTNQLDVLCWLWNNGFRPKREKDRENFAKILYDNKDLVLEKDLFVSPKEGSGIDSVRLVMEKKIQPGENVSIENTQKNVRSAVNKS